MQLNADYRIDSIKAFNEFMFTYYITAVKYFNAQLDLKKAKENLEKEYCDKYTNDAASKIFRDNKVAVAYDFKDKEGKFLAYFICGK